MTNPMSGISFLQRLHCINIKACSIENLYQFVWAVNRNRFYQFSDKMNAFIAVLLVALASNVYAQAGGSTQPSGSCSECTSLIQADSVDSALLRVAIDLTWASNANQCAKEKVICNLNPVCLRLQGLCDRIAATLPKSGLRLLEDYMATYRTITATYIDSLVIKLASVPSSQTDDDITAIQPAVDALRIQCEDTADFMDGLATTAEQWAVGAPATNPDTIAELQTDISAFENIILVSEFCDNSAFQMQQRSCFTNSVCFFFSCRFSAVSRNCSLLSIFSLTHPVPTPQLYRLEPYYASDLDTLPSNIFYWRLESWIINLIWN